MSPFSWWSFLFLSIKLSILAIAILVLHGGYIHFLFTVFDNFALGLVGKHPGG